jgi:predicted amino acid racemase
LGVSTNINHFRIGEAAFFGVSPLYNERFKELNTDTFEFEANIIELAERKIVPEGVLSDANIGRTADFDVTNMDETTIKGILDFGLLDVDNENIVTLDEGVSFVGITSDMMVVDLGSNKNSDGMKKYRVGDRIRFKPNYMAVARLLNSKFIDKQFV